MTTATANIITARPAAKFTPARRVVRSRRLGAGVTVLLVMLINLSFGGGTAHAILGIPNIGDAIHSALCGGTDQPAAQVYGQGLDSIIPQTAPDVPLTAADGTGQFAAMRDRQLYGGRQTTYYEKYGTAGTQWTSYEACLFPDQATTYAANMVFAFAKVVDRVVISTFQMATAPDMLKAFLGPLDTTVRAMKDRLFLNYLLPIVVMGAIFGAYKGLVKKRSSEAVQSWIWMFGATAFALIFLSQPSFIAQKADNFVSQMGADITNAMVGVSGNQKSADPCIASGEAMPAEVNGISSGNRVASNALYCSFVWTPWVAGQFGPLQTAAIKAGAFPDARVAQLAVTALDHDQAIQASIDPTKYTAFAAEKKKIWEDLQKGMKSDQGALYSTWAGTDAGSRIVVATGALLAAIIGGILIAIVSFTTIVLHLAMIMLMFAAALFLLIGVHPGFGRGIALKWLEMLLGTVLKRIVLAFVVALLAGCYQVVLSSGMSWFTQQALIAALGITIIMYRKKILDLFDVINLGGVSNGMDKMSGGGLKKGAGMGVGAVSGAGAAFAAGGAGAVLGGTLKGGLMGRGSGSPLRAATTGASAGRRVGARTAAKAKAAGAAAPKVAVVTKLGGGQTPHGQEAVRLEKESKAKDQEAKALRALYAKDPGNPIFNDPDTLGRAKAATERADAAAPAPSLRKTGVPRPARPGGTPAPPASPAGTVTPSGVPLQKVIAERRAEQAREEQETEFVRARQESADRLVREQLAARKAGAAARGEAPTGMGSSGKLPQRPAPPSTPPPSTSPPRAN